MERIVIVTLCLVGLGVPAAAHSRSWQEQSTRTLPASGIRTLRVENSRGVVTVRPSQDGQIHLTALKVVRSEDRDWADRVSRETEVLVENEAGELFVRVRYPQRQTVRVRFWDLFSDFELPRVEMRLALDVPADLPVRLKSSSGDLETADLHSLQVLESTSGDIVAIAADRIHASTTSGDLRVTESGAARLKTVSGDILVERPVGPLNAETASGDLTVRGARDSLVLRSVSGDLLVERAPRGVRAFTASGGIDVRSASGAVTLEASNGDVEVGLVPPVARVEVETANGDIVAKLSEQLSCRLDLSTVHGEIELDVPLDLRNITRHQVAATVRGGSAPVILRSSSGDITVSEASR